MNIQPIILAAGKGTRMGQSALPKVLVLLKGMPLISYLIRELNKVKLDSRPIIVVGHKYDLVQSALGSSFDYAFQQGQLGTAHAVKASKDLSTAKNILVLYGDMPFITSEDIENIINRHEQTNSKFTMFTVKVPNFENKFASFSGFGRIKRDDQGKLIRIVEFVDASEDEKNINEVNPGIYVFDSEWLWNNIDKIQLNKHSEYYLTDIMEIALKDRIAIETLEIDPVHVYGINTPQQLKEAEMIMV